jgi:predicted ester cyclase
LISIDRNKDIVKLHFQRISEGDSRGAAALFALVSQNHGKEVARKDIEHVFEGIVGLHEQFVIHEIIGEGDWVACRATVSGKHERKPMIPVGSGVYSISEPEGQPYTIQHMHLFKIVDGQIVEHWANRDDLGAARQLGLELAPTK